MNLKATSTAITRKFGSQVLALKKNSPALMFVAGVAGVGATVFLACRATLKLEETLDASADRVEHLKEIAARPEESYVESDLRKAVAMEHVKLAYNITKLYGPAFLVGVASVGALTGAHVTQTRRMSAVTAAYAGLDKIFNRYRDNVRNELGEDKDQEFYYGVETVERVEETDKGPVVKTVKVLKNETGLYDIMFDESARNWQTKPGHNQTFVKIQQNWANDMLRSRGWVTLNEVLDLLTLPRTEHGMVYGWIYTGDKSTGDDYIDFGVFSNHFEGAQRFVNCWEPSVLLHFNCDGNIYQIMKERKKS